MAAAEILSPEGRLARIIDHPAVRIAVPVIIGALAVVVLHKLAAHVKWADVKADLSAASWLRRGQAFTLPNTTHAPAERSPCARRMLADFLDRPRRAVDARCVSIERPRFPFRLRRG